MSELQTNLIGQISVKKRGRKSKKEIEEAQKLSENQPKIITENIVVKIEENEEPQLDTSCIDEIINSDDDSNVVKNKETTNSDKPIAKKRGRKPKGGKIIQQIVPLNNNKETKPNVILHLKCSLKDLNSNNLFGSSLEGYSFSNSSLRCCTALASSGSF